MKHYLKNSITIFVISFTIFIFLGIIFLNLIFGNYLSTSTLIITIVTTLFISLIYSSLIISLISLGFFIFSKNKLKVINDFISFLVDFKFLFITILLNYILIMLAIKFSNGLLLFLNFNILLAYFAYFISKITTTKFVLRFKILKYLLLLVWLLFLPNTFYIFTDFIHLQNYLFFSNPSDLSLNTYIYDIESWVVLFSISILSLYGGILGIKSFQNILNTFNIKSKHLKLIIIESIFLLSSFGIYLGRFIRLNSWNFLNIFNHLNVLSKAFTWIFILGFLIIHNVLYVLFNNDKFKLSF
ncbi:DUF1361 domain-containing protein [Acholeplasma granularum]|uniref:DUF1361 domain-containing protein n=1 Tax=Acholeplasma granularum TaxID=264635 RepID=UPI00046FB56D|nr:DUF1361 domain-containing protein [Acholeplasma granularum]